MSHSYTTLKEFFTVHYKAAIAFSGGVDSTYLLYAAAEAGADIKAYYIQTAFQPKADLRLTEEFCRRLGVPYAVISLDIFACPEVIINPADRCYHCKRRIFSTLLTQAEKDGYSMLLDGTNASDPEDDRPGMRALRELGITSPLKECGLTKTAIRTLSREAGLDTWNMPSYACLATRIPTNTPITAEDLQRVEAAELALAEMGFRDLRVRLMGTSAKLQLPADQFIRAAEMRQEILNRLSPYFTSVVLDLQARNGLT